MTARRIWEATTVAQPEIPYKPKTIRIIPSRRSIFPDWKHESDVGNNRHHHVKKVHVPHNLHQLNLSHVGNPKPHPNIPPLHIIHTPPLSLPLKSKPPDFPNQMQKKTWWQLTNPPSTPNL